MVRIKQVGKNVNVYVDGKTYTLVSPSKELELQAFRYAMLANMNGSEYAKNQLLKLIDQDKAKKEKQLSEVKTEKKKVENKIKTIEKGSLSAALKPYFTHKNGALQIKGINIDFPAEYIKILDNCVVKGYKVEAMKNFLQLLALNPSKYIRDNIFQFLVNQKFPITDNGYIVSLRRVHKLTETDNSVKEAYTTVKKRKKNPNKYYLKDGKITSLPNGKSIGELIVQEQNFYTDNHTKKFRWKLKDICVIPRINTVGSEDSQCGTGLHFGSDKYVVSNKWLGDTIVLGLINPSKLVNIPPSQSYKLMVEEAYFVSEVDESEVKSIFTDPFKVVGTLDKEYEKLDMLGELGEGVEFNHIHLNLAEQLEAARLRLEEIRTSAKLYNTVTEFSELEKIVQSRITNL